MEPSSGFHPVTWERVIDVDDVASASRVRAIFEEVHNSNGELISSYNIKINNFDQLRYVQRLLGCGLLFV
jgi:hypothetical protein